MQRTAVYDQKEMLSLFSKALETKSISPEMGGSGESKRADLLERALLSWGLKPKRYDYVDKWKTRRSNLVVKFGDKPRTLWILAHIDTVAEGEVTLWKTDPFRAVIKGGRVYCRGTNDDGGGMISGMFALKSLLGAKEKLKYNFGLVLAADEECGSKYGVYALLKERIFGKSDLFLVPDFGNPEGSEIEVAEKSLLWLKITVTGKQVHASTPWKGINAFREAAEFALDAERYLYRKYRRKPKMMPKGSSFAMTKHEKNVDSVNILPGREVFYLDCRIVPGYNPSDVINDLRRLALKRKAKIRIEIANREDAAPPTSERSEIVALLTGSIKRELGITPICIGIGGGTVAKPLRAAGFQAAVWRVGEKISHQPNEYVEISALDKMIRVFRGLYL